MIPHKLILIPILLVCFGLAPLAQAVVPAPDGGYPGFNTAEGTNALFSLNIAGGGVFNTALGGFALSSDTIGAANTGVGVNALRFNTEGDSNTAVGANALLRNITGLRNVAVGQGALANNNGANSNDNVAVGFQALGQNFGVRNVAIGTQALFSNTSAGNASNAVGYQALFHNTVGLFNNAFGWLALFSCTSGDNNTAIGDGSGDAITTGNNNTCLGANAGTGFTTASNSVAIGTAGANASNTTYVRNILGTFQPLVGGVVGFVTVGPNGRLGNGSFSSQRYKDDIKPMDKASEEIYQLKPVAFRFKEEFEPTHSQQYGLIAEEVEKVNANLVIYDEEGKVRSVRYDSISNMLLNEFLKEHKKVEAQQASIAELKSTVALQQKGMEILTAQLKEQAEQIQKVSAQVELNKRAPQTVVNK